MKIWKNEEVMSLFKNVEECKQNQKALKKAFSEHAKKFGRKPNSVRNYYYHEVDNLAEEKERCRILGVDISKHTKTHFDNFDKEQESELFEKIENLTKKGLSVRSACLKLSNGNLADMTRFQNKYQNMKKKLDINNDNIIPFKQRQKALTEGEINSLFMGLVRLIKKTAIEDFAETRKTEKESSEILLQKAFFDLNKKDKQIAQLQESFEELKEENSKLLFKLKNLSSSKQEALKTHLTKKKMKEGMEG